MTRPSPDPEYLAELAALDLGREVGSILALRSKHKEQAAPSGTKRPKAPQDQAGLTRSEAEGRLSELRETFWDSAPTQLRKELQSLKLDDFPDLQRGRARLVRVAELAPEIDRAEAHPKLDERFMEALRLLLVAPEKDRSERKRRVLKAMHKPALAKSAKRSVKVLEKDFPEVFALEPDWFRRVRGAKRWLKESSSAGRALGCLGIYFLIRLVVIVLRKIMEEL